MDYEDLKLKDAGYLSVEGTLTAEYYTEITFEWIIDAICDSQPKHVGDFLIASIEHDTKADAENNYNMNQVRKAIEGIMLVHGIKMNDLIKEHRIDAQESYEKMTVEDIRDKGEIIITPRK